MEDLLLTIYYVIIQKTMSPQKSEEDVVIKVTVMQTKKAIINDCLRVLLLFIPTIHNFEIIYSLICYSPKN